MTTHRNHPPGFQDGIAERLAAGGRSAPAVEALLDLDQGLFLWHRAVSRGEGLLQVIRAAGLDLELAEFSALTAVARIAEGVGRAQAEAPTVGALAQELGLDPSRASRLAQQLIARGCLRRDVAQDDARKTVLVATDLARQMLARIREAKWAIYDATFAGWDDGDVVAFSRLMRRFMESSHQARAQISGQGG